MAERSRQLPRLRILLLEGKYAEVFYSRVAAGSAITIEPWEWQALAEPGPPILRENLESNENSLQAG